MEIEMYCTLLMFFSFAFVSRIVYRYYNNNKTIKSKEESNEELKEELKEESKQINDDNMLSQEMPVLRKRKSPSCSVTNSMMKLINYLNSARYTLDICMYVIANKYLTKAIIKLHDRGVKVRVIVDGNMAYSAGSKTEKLKMIGIQVRWVKSRHEMNHRFCVVDGSTQDESIALVLAESMDWINQPLSEQSEYVMVTSQSELVQKYRIVFEILWTRFIRHVVFQHLMLCYIKRYYKKKQSVVDTMYPMYHLIST